MDAARQSLGRAAEGLGFNQDVAGGEFVDFPTGAIQIVLAGLGSKRLDESFVNNCQRLAEYAGQAAQEHPSQGNEAEIADAMDQESRRRLLRLLLNWGSRSDPYIHNRFIPPWAIIREVALSLLRQEPTEG